MAIIEFDNVVFSYGQGNRALDHVNLAIEPGEFVCLLGENGSGKSTLARHVNALLAPTSGMVRVLGFDTRDAAATFSIRSNAGMVFQNPDDQIVASLVEDDVAFGPQNLGVSGDELRERVAEALGRVGLAGFERREVATLSGGQKQRVAIAGALAMQPRILVLDEPTSMLDPQGHAEVMSVCRDLHDQGTTIVLVTHFREEAAQAERILVLEAGRVMYDGTPQEVLGHLDWWDRSIERSPAHRIGPGTVARFEGVSFRYRAQDPWVLRSFDLEIREGEILGITGPTGSGKSTLVQLAGGLLQPDEGRVVKPSNGPASPDAERSTPSNGPRQPDAERSTPSSSPAGPDASRGIPADHLQQPGARHGSPVGGPCHAEPAYEARSPIGVVFQYPERQLFAATVYDDVAFGPRNLGLSSTDVEGRVSEAVSAMELDLALLRDKSPFSLSGGEQRRIAIAGVLAMAPHVLMLDEPTANLDPRAHTALLELLVRLNEKRGITIVLVSHDPDDLALICDRVIELG